MQKRAIYPGTFDPITNGHIDIIQRASKIFDEIIVAVAVNTVKKTYFDYNTRIALIKQALNGMDGVQVLGFECLLVDFALQQQTYTILRGLRTMNDFDYELQLAGMNRKLATQIDTIFFAPSEGFHCVSSSLIKEIASFNRDISQFVPQAVVDAFAAMKSF